MPWPCFCLCFMLMLISTQFTVEPPSTPILDSLNLVLGRFLVQVGLAVVRLLVDLVADGVLAGLDAGAERGVRVPGDLLVGFFAGCGAGTLDALADVVCSVPRGGVRELVGLLGWMGKWERRRGDFT